MDRKDRDKNYELDDSSNVFDDILRNYKSELRGVSAIGEMTDCMIILDGYQQGFIVEDEAYEDISKQLFKIIRRFDGWKRDLWKSEQWKTNRDSRDSIKKISWLYQDLEENYEIFNHTPPREKPRREKDFPLPYLLD